MLNLGKTGILPYSTDDLASMDELMRDMERPPQYVTLDDIEPLDLSGPTGARKTDKRLTQAPE